MIIKNEIPILEFDTDKKSVLMPDHEKLDMSLPEKAVFAFLGDYIDRFAKENHARIVNYFISATKKYPVYIVNYKNEEICLMQAPVGASAAAQIMDWMIGYGVKKIVSGGSCGVLADIPENLFLIPHKALREEGTSYHYMAPSRYVEMNENALCAIERALERHKLQHRRVMTWSTDGYYRETKEKVAYRKAEGCEVVEMECSALASCAQFRNIEWGEILFTADSLADVDNYEERSGERPPGNMH